MLNALPGFLNLLARLGIEGGVSEAVKERGLVVAAVKNDELVAVEALGDARRKARLALAAEAVHENATTPVLAKVSNDRLNLAPTPHELARTGDRNTVVAAVEKDLLGLARIAPSAGSGALREGPAVAGTQEEPGRMPVARRGSSGRAGRQHLAPGAGHSGKKGLVAGETAIEPLGEEDGLVVEDASRPTEDRGQAAGPRWCSPGRGGPRRVASRPIGEP
ncbi:MAG: hypothetical protein M3O15_12555 [Acidobacteriota bacterium]|nr:hypothetical protein [Acidobacteriota bacterium]